MCMQTYLRESLFYLDSTYLVFCWWVPRQKKNPLVLFHTSLAPLFPKKSLEKTHFLLDFQGEKISRKYSTFPVLPQSKKVRWGSLEKVNKPTDFAGTSRGTYVHVMCRLVWWEATMLLCFPFHMQPPAAAVELRIHPFTFFTPLQRYSLEKRTRKVYIDGIDGHNGTWVETEQHRHKPSSSVQTMFSFFYSEAFLFPPCNNSNTIMTMLMMIASGVTHISS